MPNSATADLLIVTLLPLILLPVLLERLAVRADILERCAVYHVKRYHQIGVAAGRGVRVKINRARYTSFTGAVSTTLSEQVKDEP